MGPEQIEFSKPLELMSIEENSDAEYVFVKVRAPRMAGIPLKCFTWMVESVLIGTFLKPKLKKDNLITKVFVDTRYKDPPLFQPQFSIGDLQEPEVVQLVPGSSAPQRVNAAFNCLAPRANGFTAFRHWTIRDYADAYQSGRVTPTMVAERFILSMEDMEASSLSMNIFITYDPESILQQAADSTSRYARGEQFSILDGVPIAVKDEIDCLPYSTTGGTRWLTKVRPIKDDAACVKRLRACGALLLGKTNMHELGQGTTGINPHYGATRNPYNKDRASGGSSGGSAAAVASGLCPAALGVDGGGSVRMPAGLCGIVGIKGTYGRISSSGVLPLNWTVGSVGVLASSIEDAMIVYSAIQGHLPEDQIVSLPPAANLPLLKDFDGIAKLVGGLKLAKYSKWFDDSDDSIKSACYRVLDLLQKDYGCKVVEVTVPELEEMRLAHFITIGCECYTSIGLDYEKHGINVSGGDIRVGFSIYASFRNNEYIAAQRMRYRQMHYHNEIFKKADIIITPTTAGTAPVISPGAVTFGELNYGGGAKLMRYQIAGNFLGLPAISVPVGVDEEGLPIGIQLIGKPWSEATLLRIAYAIEVMCTHLQRRPEVLYDLLLQ